MENAIRALNVRGRGRGRPKKNPIKQTNKNNDKYCWICHMEGPVWMCKGCPRSFHIRCAMSMINCDYPDPVLVREPTKDDPGELQSCSECLAAKDTNMIATKEMSSDDMKEIFRHVWKALKETYISNEVLIDICAFEGEDYAKTVGKVMDFTILANMIENGEIKTLEGFYGELRWIRHNTEVWEGDDRPRLINLEFMLNTCAKLMQEVSFCPPLYLAFARSNDKDKASVVKKFSETCDPPHILVWAKFAGHPWWPSKLMRVISEGKFCVVFFDEINRSNDIPLDNILMFSDEVPCGKDRSKRKADGKRTARRKKAIESAKEHIEALRAKYGRVILAENCSTPIPKETTDVSPESEIFKKMFPDYGQPLSGEG